MFLASAAYGADAVKDEKKAGDKKVGIVGEEKKTDDKAKSADTKGGAMGEKKAGDKKVGVVGEEKKSN